MTFKLFYLSNNKNPNIEVSKKKKKTGILFYNVVIIEEFS